MNQIFRWSIITGFVIDIIGCSSGCGEIQKRRTESNSDHSLSVADEPSEQSSTEVKSAVSTQNEESVFTTNKKYSGSATVVPSIPLPNTRIWYGIDATPVSSSNRGRALNARDDNLLTAWTCDMSKDSACVYTLRMSQPADICAIRLFATVGSDQQSAQQQGYTKTMNVHTDQGVTTVELLRRYNYQYIVFPNCVSTQVVSLQAIDSHLPADSAEMALSEVELLGTRGAKRSPMELTDDPIVTVTDHSFWVSKTEHCDNCVYQGSSATPAWLEQIDSHGNRRRMVQGHRSIATHSKRFILTSRTTSEYCPGACAYTTQNHTLIDTWNRTMYHTTFTDDVSREDTWEVRSIYRDAQHEQFGIELLSAQSGDVEWLLSLNLESDRSMTTRKALSQIPYNQRDSLLVYLGYEVPADSLPHAVPEMSPDARKKICLQIPYRNTPAVDDTRCDNAVKYQEWSRFELSNKKTLVFTSPGICDAFENEWHAFAAVLDENGTVVDSLSVSSFMSIHIFAAHVPMIEVDNSFNTSSPTTDSDIYILNDEYQFVKAFPGAAFSLPASPGCLCEA
ncbi:MAG: hypothetical protein JXX29_04725 [Deltaproteobacteria bacterium]|nr:hypothetical protein [Deltaproteobacteria bacterium]MBN2670950.1 hypothetical protein [Deltaproteobacteria bacterium]